MARVTKPIALDRSFNTTEQTSRNIADVLAEELSAIITALGGLNFINYEVVEELPTTGISTTTIYLVPSDDPQSGNTYDEYINLNGTVSGWEKIGSTAIDLSGYYTSAETDALLDEKVDKDSFDEQTATDEFSTINGGLLSALKVSLSPNQDLHGYENPWVGGAGKNKLPLILADIKSANTSGTWSGNIYSVSGGTIEVLVDDANNVIGIKPNGTFSATVIFYLVNNYTFKAGSYALNGCPTGGDSSTYELRIGNIIAQDYGSGATYTLGSDTMSMASIIIRSGQDMSGKNFYPMIRLASESDPTFESYSNICPITGHTESKVKDDGKNKADPNTLEVGYYSTTGYNSSANFKTTAPISVEVGKTYFGTVFNTNDLTEKHDVVYTTFSSDDTTNAIRQVVGGSITIQSGEKYVRVRNNSDQTALIQSGNFTYQLELGSIATPYVPYNGYQVTVNLGGTYYSGTLDVVTGVFVPDTAEVVYDGSNDEGWNSDRPNYRVFISAPDIKSDTTNIISSSFRRVLPSETYQGVSGIACSSTLLFVGTLGMSVADWRTFLSNNPIQVNYELATPTPIQLIPTPVKANVGENHLSAPLEGQEITESKYRKLFTWDEVESYVNAHSGGGSGMNYSTNEQVIGTWIDSKPLYQKTIDQTIGSDADYTVFANGIDHAHLVNSSFEYSSGRWMSFDYTSLGGASNNRTCYVDVQNGALNLHNQSNSSIHWIATIQYTKTND